MWRLNRILVTTLVVCVTGAATAASTAQGQATPRLQGQTARLLRGSVTGTVSDDRGGPLAGAVVSVLGATLATTVTDPGGFFLIDALPAGEYVLQAHLRGFAGSPRERIQVGTSSPAVFRIRLSRVTGEVGTSGTRPVSSRPIMAAGISLPASTLSDQPDSESTTAAASDHPHTETAWRLRHIKRSILKDTSGLEAFSEPDPEFPPATLLGRAWDSAATFATTFLQDLPFSGEVNLLTTSVYAPGADLFARTTLPRGVAYLSIGAPVPGGDWSVRAAMSQGDLSSWIVAGSFASRPGATHTYNVGLSYSKQEYQGGNPAALAAVTDTGRNVGELYGFDRWSINPWLTVEYGGRYAHYDYLEKRAFLSPRIGVAVEPIRNVRVTTTVAQRMIAPGAEEFLATSVPGPWLPPDRTFAPLGAPDDLSAFRVERARYVDIGLERELDDATVVSVRRFFQSVDDQLVTLFGLDSPETPRSVGHYYVASAGSLGADGWGFRVSNTASKRVRGSIDYSVTRARWLTRGDSDAIGRHSMSAVRPEAEDLHDITTTVETDFPETATHLFVIYKLNTGYTRANPNAQSSGLEGRFNLQVNQKLPFDLAGTRWEVLVGVRNLFRDVTEPGSVYDELLVVRPPTRVVGGFLVRF